MEFPRNHDESAKQHKTNGKLRNTCISIFYFPQKFMIFIYKKEILFALNTDDRERKMKIKRVISLFEYLSSRMKHCFHCLFQIKLLQTINIGWALTEKQYALTNQKPFETLSIPNLFPLPTQKLISCPRRIIVA